MLILGFNVAVFISGEPKSGNLMSSDFWAKAVVKSKADRRNNISSNKLDMKVEPEACRKFLNPLRDIKKQFFLSCKF